MLPLHQVRFHLHDLAGLGVDDARVEAEVAVEIDKRTGDDVARPGALADLCGGLGIQAARRAEILLLEELLDLSALHDARRGIGRELGNEHPRDALLERVEVLFVLSVRPAVVERHHGDSRTAVLAPTLRAQPPGCARPDQRERQEHGEPTRTQMIPHHRVRVIPSCAASTSAGRPFDLACRRAAASRASIASSPCSGSW